MTGIRAQQKQTTQMRILASARALLRDRTYEEVGVRDIADGAGVAAGTVIASFGSKADVLEALIIEDFRAQHQMALEAAKPYQYLCERLFAMTKVGLAYYVGQSGLLRATMSASWNLPVDAVARIHAALVPALEAVTMELEAARLNGQVRSDLDCRTTAMMVFDCMVSSRRIAIHGTGALAEMEEALKSRLGLLLRGVLVANFPIRIVQTAEAA